MSGGVKQNRAPAREAGGRAGEPSRDGASGLSGGGDPLKMGRWSPAVLRARMGLPFLVAPQTVDSKAALATATLLGRGWRCSEHSPRGFLR